MDLPPIPEGYGEVEFYEPIMLPAIFIDCRDPSQWVVLDGKPTPVERAGSTDANDPTEPPTAS